MVVQPLVAACFASFRLRLRLAVKRKCSAHNAINRPNEAVRNLMYEIQLTANSPGYLEAFWRAPPTQFCKASSKHRTSAESSNSTPDCATMRPRIVSLND
jgi:hypothetical protein